MSSKTTMVLLCVAIAAPFAGANIEIDPDGMGYHTDVPSGTYVGQVRRTAVGDDFIYVLTTNDGKKIKISQPDASLGTAEIQELDRAVGEGDQNNSVEIGQGTNANDADGDLVSSVSAS